MTPSLVKPLLLVFFNFFLLPLAAFSTPVQFKTLIPKSLPIPHPLTPADEIEIGDTAVSFQLHHIDSLISFNATPESLINLRLQRDAKRVNSIFSAVGSYDGGGFNTSVISGLVKGSSEYFARFGIGTPPVYSYMFIDTGSDMTWIQCSPCRKCYDQTDRLYNPSRSTSYSSVACDSNHCRQHNNSDCDHDRTNSCLYKVEYGDGSTSSGDLITETLTFRGKRISNVTVGCGHDNEGLFVGAAGLLGLGRGNLSFPSQINNKFSYCLVSRNSSPKPSFLIFGNASISRTALYTPLLTNPKQNDFYYLDLIGISVEGKRLPEISQQMFKFDSAGDGGVVIDSGTSVTRLTNKAYIPLRDAFRHYSSELKPTKSFLLFDTCFDLSGKKSVKVPSVALHFTNAVVSLPAENYLIPVDSNGTFCFAFSGSPGKMSIIGNIQQQGFRVVYDLEGSRIGFSANGCK